MGKLVESNNSLGYIFSSKPFLPILSAWEFKRSVMFINDFKSFFKNGLANQIFWIFAHLSLTLFKTSVVISNPLTIHILFLAISVLPISLKILYKYFLARGKRAELGGFVQGAGQWAQPRRRLRKGSPHHWTRLQRQGIVKGLQWITLVPLVALNRLTVPERSSGGELSCHPVKEQPSPRIRRPHA